MHKPWFKNICRILLILLILSFIVQPIMLREPQDEQRVQRQLRADNAVLENAKEYLEAMNDYSETQ